MKNFEIICGNEKYVKLVQINGTTALAKEAKPTGELKAIVKGSDTDTGKETFYLCMEVEQPGGKRTLGIYATQVRREIDKVKDLFIDSEDPLIITCTEGVSRKTNQKFLKIMVESC